VRDFLIATSKTRGYHQNNKINNTHGKCRSRQVKDGGGRVAIGQLLVEIWGFNCVGAAACQKQ
jgi:hypothetical protein